MTKVPENNRRIKAKLIFGFLSILLVILAITGIVYSNLKHLENTTVKISQPNHRLVKLNEILYDISEAESNIRTYALTLNEDFLKQYFSQIYSITHDVDSLYILPGKGNVNIQLLDSISILLFDKLHLLNELVELKRVERASSFYDVAIERVAGTGIDTAKITEVRKSAHQTVIIDPHEDSEVREEGRTGFFGKVKELFSRTEESDIQDGTITDRRIKSEMHIDSVIIYHGYTDSIIFNIQQILTDVRDEAEREEQILSSRETNLLIKDMKVMDEIRQLITLMEQEENLSTQAEVTNVDNIVKDTTKLIILFIAVGLMLITIFTWLITRYITRSDFQKKLMLEEKQRAQELVKTKEQFIANMSHEIRTPLGAIIGFTNQLKKTSVNKEQNSYLDALYKSSNHLLDIVNDILDYSKIAAGKMSFDNTPFTIEEVVMDVYQTLRIYAEGKNIKFEYEFSGNTSHVLSGDPFRIRQILMNLAGNGIKFTKEGHVKIIASIINETDTEQKVRFDIEDTGIGIPQEKQSKIFEEFNQADSSTTRKYGGTGLGLTISRKLSQLMGGEIKLSSEAGKGSVFSIFLSFNKSTEVITAPLDKTIKPSAELSRKLHLLLVDDDEINLVLLGSIIKQWGITFDSAPHVIEAFDLVAQKNFDLVITDIHMPEISGLEFVKMIRSMENTKRANLPIIVLTANIFHDDVEQFTQAGVNDYLVKPFDEKELFQKIYLLTGLGNIDKLNQSTKLKSTIDVTENNTLKPYLPDGLIKFTNGNNESINLVLNAFVFDTRQNLEKLTFHANKQDINEVANVAHKMLNMFRILKIQKIIPLLMELEYSRNEKFNDKLVLGLINQISTETIEILEVIEADLNMANKVQNKTM